MCPMWKRIKNSNYCLMSTKENGFFEICVTDFLAVWKTLYSEKEFLAQLKENNDGLELQNDNEFVQKGLHLLSNLDQLKKLSIEKEENGKSLFINMTISFGFPFDLKCKLMKGSEQLYFQKITQPFLKTIGDLRSSQSELRRLLIKKDSEIEEYKCEGGEIVLRHLKTVAFNDEEHMKKHKEYEENFGALDTLTSIIEKVVEIPHQNTLKQEPNVTENLGPALNVKTEPGLNVKTDPVPITKTEPVPIIKTEPNTEVVEPTSAPVITESVVSTCKQEVKRETSSRAHIPRKRSKFNF